MKILKLALLASISICSISGFSQTVTGSLLNIQNVTPANTNNISSGNDGDNSSYIRNNSTSNVLNSSTITSGSYVSNTFITTAADKAQVASSGEVSLFSGPLDSTSGNLSGASSITLTPTRATMIATGDTAYTGVAWGPTGSTTTADYTNFFSADASGSNISSATAITMTAVTTNITSTTNNILGTTNINTTGNSSTSLGGAGTGSVTLTSGINSIAVSNSGTVITSPTTIVGATNINTTGTANTSIGNTTGMVTVNGSTVNVGTNSASTVAIGSNLGNSTVSMNGNRLQNIANGTAGTDAVNLNQLNSVAGNVSNLNSQFNNLNNQLQQSQTEYRSGIAGVAAMNGIGALNGNQRVNFGIGVGGFAGQSGIAAGGNVRITDNATFKAAVAQANSNTAVSGGITIGF